MQVSYRLHPVTRNNIFPYVYASLCDAFLVVFHVMINDYDGKLLGDSLIVVVGILKSSPWVQVGIVIKADCAVQVVDPLA